MNKQFEISNITSDVVGQGNIIFADLLIVANRDAITSLKVYVGFDKRLHIEGMEKGISCDVPSLIQWAAWLVAHENAVIFEITEKAKTP